MNATMKRTESSNPNSSENDSLPSPHPNENKHSIRILGMSFPPHCNLFFNMMHHLKEGKQLWVQVLTIYTTAILTYGYTNSQLEGIHTNVQIAIMTVITLVGASPLVSTHLIPATIGVFTGGHNIIGSVGLLMEDEIEVTWRNYAWLLLLASVVAFVWQFLAKYKLFDGYSGRLGTATFIGMNLAMLIFGPLGVVSWDRYYYGLVQVLNSAEDSIPLSRAWIEEAELAAVYVIAVVFIGVVGGGTRVLHNSYIKRLETANEESCSKEVPRALNNIVLPVLYALISMLLVIVSGYKNAPALFNGFAVGSYVAMASLQKIPSIRMFALVSLFAAGWGLALTPFCVGFPGKSGFTAMMGHATCCLLESAQNMLRARRKAREKQQQQQQQLAASSSYDDDEYSDQDDADQEAPESPRIDHHFKPRTEYSVITKHQRRQQRKLKHLRERNFPYDNVDILDPPILHHRAWSAKKEDIDDGAWRHSLKKNLV